MDKFAKLTERVASIPENTALWFSSGKDSLLLLHTMLLFEAKFSILQFDTLWTRKQKEFTDSLTKRHSLTIYSYKPVYSTIFGDGGTDLTVSTEYAVGPHGESVPIFRDVVPGVSCAYDMDVKLANRSTPPVLFDLHVVGSKRNETHYAFGGKDVCPGAEFKVGSIPFCAPLYDWSDAEVIEALSIYFGVEYEKPSDEIDGGNVPTCTLCFNGRAVECPKTGEVIDPIEWSPRKNLQDWRMRHFGALEV